MSRPDNENAPDRDRDRGLAWRLRQWASRRMLAPEDVASHPMLRPIAGHLRSPRLWHLQHEAVARGVAIGLFWAFIMPVAQIPLAAAHCIWWRANIPLAVLATLITNPLTLGFWLWAAYQVGGLFLAAPPLVMPAAGTSLVDWFQALGKPVLLGMGLLGSVSSVSAYVSIRLAWRLSVSLRWRARSGRSKPRQSTP